MTDGDATCRRGSADPNLVTLSAQWLAGRVARGELSAASAQTVAVQLRSLTGRHGGSPAELDRQALLEWQASIGHRKPATRKAYLCGVQAFCRWLVEEGYLEADPAAKLVRPKLPRQAPRALPVGDVTRSLAACRNARERAIVVLEVGAGLRAAEVAGGDMEDWDRERRLLHVTGKFGHERWVPLSDEVEAALLEHLAQRGDTPGPLIQAVGSRPGPDGRVSARWLSKLIARRMTEAGVHRPGDRKTGHAFRHTFATDTLAASGDLSAVKDLMGHANIATTNIYLGGAGEERLRAAVEGRLYVRPADHSGGIPAPAAEPEADPQPVPVPVPTVMPLPVELEQHQGSEPCSLHCPSCCTTGAGDACDDEECGSWGDVPATAFTVVRRRDSPTGWRFSAVSPRCGHKVVSAITEADVESLFALVGTAPEVGDRHGPAPSYDKNDPATTRIHCVGCCSRPAGFPCSDAHHEDSCAGWLSIQVNRMRLWKSNTAAGWWYDASCPGCGQTVDGPLGAHKAKSYLARGAVRAI